MKTLDRFRLDGMVAVVTGAAGLYGRQIARALGEAGARVVATGRSREKLEAYVQTLQSEGIEAQGASLDQADEASVESLLEQIQNDHGAPHVLVNNAVDRPMADWSDAAEDFARSMAVNATGLFMMIRAFGDAMAEAGRGSIVNVASIQGMVGPDYSLYEDLDWGCPPDYFFHKGGMLQLTRFAAAKLGPRGVRVNAISPGGFFNHQDERFVKRYNARTFLGRMANATDLMGAVVFLASDASAYVTGVNIPIDGGYAAK